MNKAVIFDLDGTLIDSMGGIANAVNETRKLYNLPPQEKELIKSFIGNGVRKLIERSFALDNSDIPLDDAVDAMVKIYGADPVAGTFLYEGVKETLTELKKNNWLLAVVSNKPQTASEKILTALDIRKFFAENIGGGGNFPLKPAPDAMNHLLEKYHIRKENCFVAGDNYTDIDFAANTGTKSIFCSWGFGYVGNNPATFTAKNFPEIRKIVSEN